MALALLRGINVGGKNKLARTDLARFFTDAGCDRVQTYIQSGNVIFNAPDEILETIAGTVQTRIASELGYTIPVILRTAAELEDAIKNNPFVQQTLHIAFLATTPSPAAVAALDPNRSPPDSFIVRGREIYLCTPNGLGRSRLTNAWFDVKLSTVSTLRTWNTVLKLRDILGDLRN